MTKEKNDQAAAETTVVMRMLRTYRGHLTNERYFLEGSLIAFPEHLAPGLIAAGVAEMIDDPDPRLVMPFDKSAEYLTGAELERVELITERATVAARLTQIDARIDVLTNEGVN